MRGLRGAAVHTSLWAKGGTPPKELAHAVATTDAPLGKWRPPRMCSLERSCKPGVSGRATGGEGGREHASPAMMSLEATSTSLRMRA